MVGTLAGGRFGLGTLASSTTTDTCLMYLYDAILYPNDIELLCKLRKSRKSNGLVTIVDIYVRSGTTVFS